MAKDTKDTLLEKMMKQVLRLLIYLLIFVVIFALIILPMVKKHFPNTFGGSVEDSVLRIENTAIDTQYVEGLGYGVVVVGNAVNDSNNKISKATITFDLMDDTGAIVSTAVVVVEDIAKGTKVPFEAAAVGVLEDIPSEHKLKDIIII